MADLIVERSRAQERTRGAWRMAAIGVSEDEARALLAPYRGAIHIAAVNAPTQVTLAGEAAAVEELAATLTERGRFARVLPLPYAFHSPAMDVVRDDFLSVVSHVGARAATTPYLSTVTGGELPGEALGPDYWWRNLRQPVQFAAARADCARPGSPHVPGDRPVRVACAVHRRDIGGGACRGNGHRHVEARCARDAVRARERCEDACARRRGAMGSG